MPDTWIAPEALTDPRKQGGSFLPRFSSLHGRGPERRLNGGGDIEALARARPGGRLRANSRQTSIRR